ncbi:MAG: hypothetical protein PHC68_00390 [Syntrophorhabdaceae bacterium]|nr:hypothetical protein [Syntrophorhabdaceae bacterium]
MKRLLYYLIAFIIIATTSPASSQSRGKAEPPSPFANASKSEFGEGMVNVFLSFDGVWKPGIDASLIGARNFKTLQNMRPTDTGLEGIGGYTKATSAIINSNNFKARGGFHFKKDYPTESHVLAQVYDSGLQFSKVFQDKTTIPNVGNFESTPLHSDASYSTITGDYGQKTGWGIGTKTAFVDATSSGITRTAWANVSTSSTILSVDTLRSQFSPAPGGQVVYCNGVETKIWAGDYAKAAAFIVTSSNVTEYVIDGKDYTEQVNNEYSDADNIANISGSGSTVYWLVGSSRPISGVTYLVATANSSAGKKVYCQEWNGATWADVVTTDGTGGLTINGKVSFPSTVGTSKTKYIEGMVLYWYLFRVEGSAKVYNVALDIPWQSIVDIWDGTPRTCLSAQVSRKGVLKDFTLEVNERSSELYPIGAEIGGLVAGDYITTVFTEKQHAVKFDMLSGNTNAFTQGVTPYYWSGTTWTIPATFYDGTAAAGITPFFQTGVISWAPPSGASEFAKESFGVYGYTYKFEVGGTIGWAGAADDAIVIDTIFGIPAPIVLGNFKFPVFYDNRVFLCGYLKGNQSSRVDFSKTYAPDVWNGSDTSDDGRQSLYIGEDKELTGAASLFNRYGAEMYSVLLFFKNNETYVMKGSTALEYAKSIFRVSSSIGCPAPSTITTVEMAYELVSDELLRNVVIWLSATGPFMFDGSTMVPVKGIEPFFDPGHSLYVGSNAIQNAFAWKDQANKEWNLRVGEYWFVYDLMRRKWFEKDTGPADMPQCAIEVTATDGAPYIYAGLDSGYLARLENGYDWSGVSITQVVETGKFFLDENAWQQTLLRRFKLMYRPIEENTSVNVVHYDEDYASGTSIFSSSLYGTNSDSTIRFTKSLNRKSWLHQLKFTATTSSRKGFQPLGWGYQFKLLREDE